MEDKGFISGFTDSSAVRKHSDTVTEGACGVKETDAFCLSFLRRSGRLKKEGRREIVEILSYFETKKPEWWLKKIAESDWTAGQYLHETLREGRFHSLLGDSARLLMLTDGSSLVSFCTLSERDCIPDTELAPWMGFVYTFPEFRGRRLMGRLIGKVKELAREDGADRVYLATDETGLYEKYGAVYQTMLRDAHGEMSRIYRLDTYGFAGWETADCEARTGEYAGIRTPRDLYSALWHVWSAETCAPRMRAEWSGENRTLGQCSVTAFLAQDIFGGKVYGIPLPEGGFHCYNAAGDCVFDLTSEQFGNARFTYAGHPEQLRTVHFQKEEKRERYEKLKAGLKAFTG